MNRRSLFRKLGAAAVVVAVAPVVVVQAEPMCAECEQIRANPVPLPDAYHPNPEMAAAVLELTHAHAIREGISHRVAATLLYPMYMPSYIMAPATPLDDGIGYAEDYYIRPMSIVRVQGTASGGWSHGLGYARTPNGGQRALTGDDYAFKIENDDA